MTKCGNNNTGQCSKLNTHPKAAILILTIRAEEI